MSRSLLLDSKGEVIAKHDIFAIHLQLKAPAHCKVADKIMQTMDRQMLKSTAYGQTRVLRRARTWDEGQGEYTLLRQFLATNNADSVFRTLDETAPWGDGDIERSKLIGSPGLGRGEGGAIIQPSAVRKWCA